MVKSISDGTPGGNRTRVAALIWRVLSPVYKSGALTNVSYRGKYRKNA